MVTVTGYVEGIIYRNEDNGYTVFVLSSDEEFITVTGTFPLIREGDFITVQGEYVDHDVYGEQFKACSYELASPVTCAEIEEYLSSGIVSGIGPKVARDLVDYFGESTLKIIENEPQKLLEVHGIGAKKAAAIHQSYCETASARRAVMFLQKFDITPKMALKIYTYYGDRTVEVLQANPFSLVNDIDGIGFLTADRIASSMGLDKGSHFRIAACIRHCLTEAGNEGNVYLPEDILLARASELLLIESDLIRTHLEKLSLEQSIIRRIVDGVTAVYHPAFYYAEALVAGKLLQLNSVAVREQEKSVLKEIDAYEADKGITLAENQRLAVLKAMTGIVTIITGGPGTGKTTTLGCILHLLNKRGENIALAAPTGRAAKRMSEATGEDAKTIHRLLEYSKTEEGKFIFKRNAESPLDVKTAIIDEASMIDIFLMQSLLDGLSKGTRLILVGDVDQLSSVGAGNVLGDMIASELFSTVRLDIVFRQANESMIITNAHKINSGEMPVVNTKGSDFFLDRRQSEGEITKTVIDLIKRRLPDAYGFSPVSDIQVLTPIKKGATGVFNLNKLLQDSLNPRGKSKNEITFGEDIFREGDKVMQIRNNYDREWTVMEKYGNLVSGTGIFNGDSGIISSIDAPSREVTVQFDDLRSSTYSYAELDELQLSYAISVHKSQGCEFPVVIMPLPITSIRIMTRNLMYTAVTRAKKLVVLVGNDRSIYSAINNLDTHKRFSSLDLRLKTAQKLT